MNLRRRIITNFLIGLCGALGLGVVLFLRTLLLASYLEVADFGIIVALMSLFVLICGIFDGGIAALLFHLYPRYLETKRRDMQAAIFYMLLGICAVGGCLIVGVMMLFATYIANHGYHDPAMAGYLRLYCFVAFALPTLQLAQTILRIHNKYAIALAPQVGVQALILIILTMYLVWGSIYDLHVVVQCLMLGELVAALIILGIAVWTIRDVLLNAKLPAVWKAMKKSRRRLIHSLWGNNVAAYLRLLVNPGDEVLLSFVASPSQLAIYGLGKRIARPMRYLLQMNVNAAITPEITRLLALRQYQKTSDFVFQYVKKMSLWSLPAYVVIGGGLWIALPYMTQEEYVASRPILMIWLLWSYITIAGIPGYALCLGLNRLTHFNIGLAAGPVLLLGGLFFGLDALLTALIVLGSAVAVAAIAYLPAFIELRKLARLSPANSQSEKQPPQADS